MNQRSVLFSFHYLVSKIKITYSFFFFSFGLGQYQSLGRQFFLTAEPWSGVPRALGFLMVKLWSCSGGKRASSSLRVYHLHHLSNFFNTSSIQSSSSFYVFPFINQNHPWSSLTLHDFCLCLIIPKLQFHNLVCWGSLKCLCDAQNRAQGSSPLKRNRWPIPVERAARFAPPISVK